MKAETKTRIAEGELILPSLLVLSNSKSGRISTSLLIDRLRDLLRPTGEDTKLLIRRQDDKFSQKVRNLVSHKTLERDNYAIHKDGVFQVTTNGRKYLKEKYDVVRYLITNDFDWTDLKKGFNEVEKNKKRKIEIFDENVIINEGFKKTISINVYERSTKLRQAAISAFTLKGHISCDCCKFNFASFYGSNIGSGYIEIHHVKPIFKYEGDEINKFINDALKNLVPVCSNCHRMIHRVWKNPLEIQTLQASIKKNGKFSIDVTRKG
ncbi:HNH endonuclease [Pedobacter changchengzhani]|uniref:HNH endonuclease n=1 Tax=Pedobacter changchengzhani TaxID=2529274 RepID=A0A4R5MLP8_9SPHI|nr:HNH endonuclease [Pedobacter changchengzhani]TDG36687.1 HNH endonuclease [Pedobacter changchengzhani]